jgi:hypothetical protein
MSWIEKINTDLTVTCGDGKEYTPKWLNASRTAEYNVAEFEYTGTAGTNVHRGEAKGAKYNIELVFDGEDHLEVAEAFDKSAADKRAWTISHPFYGAILVQPASLSYDNSVLNVTRISGTVAQTIGNAVLKAKVSAPDKIADDKAALDQKAAQSFAEDIPAKKADVLQQIKDNVEAVYNMVSMKIADTTDASDFFNKYNELNALINETIYDAYAIATQVQELLSMPANFAQSLKDRIDMFGRQLDLFAKLIPSLEDKYAKKVFELQVMAAIGGMLLATVTNIAGAYTSRTQVLSVIDKVVKAYNNFVGWIDVLVDANGGNPLFYVTDPGPLTDLGVLVSYVVGNLFEVAQDSRQERTIILEADSDPIKLTHRFYGLDDADVNTELFISSNNLAMGELLEIGKGRKIIYYV